LKPLDPHIDLWVYRSWCRCFRCKEHRSGRTIAL
jgi:hypothetical protein